MPNHNNTIDRVSIWMSAEHGIIFTLADEKVGYSTTEDAGMSWSKLHLIDIGVPTKGFHVSYRGWYPQANEETYKDIAVGIASQNSITVLRMDSGNCMIISSEVINVDVPFTDFATLVAPDGVIHTTWFEETPDTEDIAEESPSE